MISKINYAIEKMMPIRHLLLFCVFFCSCSGLFAQSKPTVSSSLDSTKIKIGEQINFKVIVEVDSMAEVIFPEGQTFSPLETVEAYKTDTTRKKDRLILEKTYALTQFDSGLYKLPTQRIEINGEGFFTDSLMVKVTDVAVDTMAQKMFDIKPLMEVKKTNTAWWKILLGILLGLLVIALLYWFVFRKKPLTEEEKVALLPPYDRALMELKKLENSKYLIQDEYKQYYSELTEIVRSYLEEDVHVSALESTSNQLIDKLEMMRDAGELELENDTIQQFKRILQTADLVKFAKSKPELSVAEQDRKSIEQIVIKTHDALPEPTEEELMQLAEYQEELERKKQKKKLVIAVVSLVAFLVLSTASAIGYYGWKYTKDTVLGNPTKVLLEGEWVTSSYGYPPIILETPEVLSRDMTGIKPESDTKYKEISSFKYNSEVGLFSIRATSRLFKEAEEADFEKYVERYIEEIELKGAKNLIVKQDEFVTASGVQGLKTHGTGKFKTPGTLELSNGEYVVLTFGGTGFIQQVEIFWLKDDDYSKQIVERVLLNLEVKTVL